MSTDYTWLDEDGKVQTATRAELLAREPAAQFAGSAQEWADHFAWVGRVVSGEPEPESVTVTLPRPLTPADFGWTVLGEGQVAVERRRLEDVVIYAGSPAAVSSARILRDALDGES